MFASFLRKSAIAFCCTLAFFCFHALPFTLSSADASIERQLIAVTAPHSREPFNNIKEDAKSALDAIDNATRSGTADLTKNVEQNSGSTQKYFSSAKHEVEAVAKQVQGKVEKNVSKSQEVVEEPAQYQNANEVVQDFFS